MNTSSPVLNSGDTCTLDTCSILQYGYIHYSPSIFGKVLFLVILLIAAVGQLYLVLGYKTALVCISMLHEAGEEFSETSYVRDKLPSSEYSKPKKTRNDKHECYCSEEPGNRTETGHVIRARASLPISP